MPRNRKSDTGIRVQGIPQDVGDESQEGYDGKNEKQDDEGEDEHVHGFRFLALWWWLYSGKLVGRAILYSVVSGWALLRFLSGSQVSSAVEYPFHLIRNVWWPGIPLCPRTALTSYSSSPSIRSGGGRRKLGPCSDVSL